MQFSVDVQANELTVLNDACMHSLAYSLISTLPTIS